MSSARIEDPFGLVGTTLDGQHRANQVVGEGGFGVVYRGWQLSLEQPIAIKALKVVAADDRAVQDALFEKFKDEAKLLYTLSQASLHVVRSIDFGAVTSPTGLWAPYMVLEWLQGLSLADDLSQRRRRGMQGRSLDEALAVLEPAAEGLGVAHQRRVAHRDIKPANIFLLDATDGPRVKVLDFGIAKIIRDGEGPGTRSPFASFTWLYAAPEQLNPRLGQTGLATDVYAFALLLTELLTDRLPTDGRDVVSLLKASTDPTVRPTPRQRGAAVPDGVEVACRRALAVDPAARFANIGELWAALAAARRPTLVPSVVGPSPSLAPVAPSLAAVAPSLGPSTMPSAGAPSAATYASQHVPLQGPANPMPFGPPHYVPPPGMFSGSNPLAHPTAVAMSPPPMSPPPGTMAYPHARRMMPKTPSSLPMVIAVIGVVLGLMFVATCSAVHAACG